ncbi:hypothetical protein HKX48_006926 [Thoreauomyces humboldtii]|nr:hypothetical protein HKX48_006926 [Thoreauomyces humboldtii]
MDLRESFIARHARDCVARGITEYPFMETFEDGGCCVIADISGYSTLASYLERRYGNEGAARIQSLLSPGFSSMIDAVHRHSGSVVKFAGDSLVSVFCNSNGSKSSQFLTPATDESVREFFPGSDPNGRPGPPTRTRFGDVAAGFLCCLELLLIAVNSGDDRDASTGEDGQGSFTSPEQRILQGVSIHIGIGGGTTNHTHVGRTGDACEYFVTGNSAATAAAMVEIAKSNELAIPLDCWEVIQRDFNVSCPLAATGMLENLVKPTVFDGHVIIRSDIFESDYARHSLTWLLSMFSGDVLPSSPCSEINLTRTASAHVADYITGTIAHRLMDTNMRVLAETAELRKCAITFVRLTGPLAALATSNDPKALSILQYLMMTVLESLELYDGCLRQFNVDDKGPTLLMVWGVERYAHEESEAAHAVHAALRIARKLEATYGKGCFSLGVALGKVFSGVIGSISRSDHTVLGVPVNEAARLMCHPLTDECMILVTEEVWNECKYQFVFSATSHMVPIKGSPDPKRVYIPIRALRTSDNIRPPDRDAPRHLVGRDNEKERVCEAVKRWHETGESPVILLLGESGVGKTAMIDFIAEEAQRVAPGALSCLGRGSEIYMHAAAYYATADLLTQLIIDLDVQLLIERAKELERTEEEASCLQDSGVEEGGESSHNRMSMAESMDDMFTNSRHDSITSSFVPSLFLSEDDSSDNDDSTFDGRTFGRRRTFSSTQLSTQSSSYRTDPQRRDSDAYLQLSIPFETETRGSQSYPDVTAGRRASKSSATSPPPLRRNSESFLPSPDLLAHHPVLDQQPPPAVCHPLCPRRAQLQRDMATNPVDAFGSVHMPECYAASSTMGGSRIAGLMTKLADRVTVIAGILGIEEHLLPLLNDVIPTSFPASSFTTGLQAHERKDELIVLVIRIVRRISEDFSIPLIFILDDAQWSDTRGINLFYEVTRKCRRVLALFSMRPLGELDCANSSKVVERVIAGDGDRSPPAQVINLSGLSASETEELLLGLVHKRYPSAEGVDGRLVAEIFKRTGGNPVIIEMLGGTMLERLDGIVVDGVLRLRCLAKFEDFLPPDAATAVLAHLDRTAPAMRHVLLLASVAGQYTGISTLAAALQRNPVKEFADFALETRDGKQRLLDYLMTNDRFRFLAFNFDVNLTKGDANGTAVPIIVTLDATGALQNLNPAHTVENCESIAFNHWVVYKAIYATLIPSRRATLHASYAAHFVQLMESLDSSATNITDGTRSFFVNVINQHLDHCRPLVAPTTLIRYSHECFNLCAARGVLTEALDAYTRLDELVHLHPEVSRKELDILARVRILRYMCDLWIGAIDYPKAWSFFTLAMEELGRDVPEEKSKMWWKELRHQLWRHVMVRVTGRQSDVWKQRKAMHLFGKVFPRWANDPDYLIRLASEIMYLFDSAMHLAVHQNKLPCYWLLHIVNQNVAEILRVSAPERLRSAQLRLGLVLEAFGYPRIAKWYLKQSSKRFRPSTKQSSMKELSNSPAETSISSVSRILAAFGAGKWSYVEQEGERVIATLEVPALSYFTLQNVLLGTHWITGNLRECGRVCEEYQRLAVALDDESPRTLRPALCDAAVAWYRGDADVAKRFNAAMAMKVRLEASPGTAGFGVALDSLNQAYVFRVLVGRMHLVAWMDGGWDDGADLKDTTGLKNSCLASAKGLLETLAMVKLGGTYMAPDLWLLVLTIMDFGFLIMSVLNAPTRRDEDDTVTVTATFPFSVTIEERIQAVQDRKLCLDLIQALTTLVRRPAKHTPQAILTLGLADAVVVLLDCARPGRLAKALGRCVANLDKEPTATGFQAAAVASRLVRARCSPQIHSHHDDRQHPQRRHDPPTDHSRSRSPTIRSLRRSRDSISSTLRGDSPAPSPSLEDDGTLTCDTTLNASSSTLDVVGGKRIRWADLLEGNDTELADAAASLFDRSGQVWEARLVRKYRSPTPPPV